MIAWLRTSVLPVLGLLAACSSAASGGVTSASGAPTAASSSVAAAASQLVETRPTATVNQGMVAAGNLAAWGGTSVTTEVVPAGAQYNMVVSEGQAQALLAGRPAFGAWGTPDDVPNQVFARNRLAILPRFKPDVSYVVRIETTAPQTIHRGLVGPMEGYTGGAHQVEFVGTRNLRLVGPPRPLPAG